MIQEKFEKLLASVGTEVVIQASDNLISNVRNDRDIKRLLVDTGEFFVDYEKNADYMFDDLALALSRENLTRLANELKEETGYSFKDKLMNSLISLMSKYEIPHDIAYLYVNNIVCAVMDQLQIINPEVYDRYFQAEWKNQEKKYLKEISDNIQAVHNELVKYKSNQIDVLTGSEIDLDLRRGTINPQIGVDFFCIDDDDFIDNFSEQKNNEVIYVRARCFEEAMYSIINELWTKGDPRPVFVIKNESDWKKLSKISSTNNIYIPYFYANEIKAIEGNTNIFILSEGLPSFSNNEILLRPRTYVSISNSLQLAGMGANEANELVQETHGLYIQIKKKIFKGAFLKKPAWVDSIPDRIKKTGLLLGQWNDSEGDQVIVEMLSGISYQEYILKIKSFSNDEDPFIYVYEIGHKENYCLASVENTWEYVDISADEDIWRDFLDLFMDVINESEKLFTYEEKDRFIAQIKGEKLFFSEEIRKGMLRTLIMLSCYKNEMFKQNIMDDVVERILSYIKKPDQWKYISRFFIDLCEISPKKVLSRLLLELEKKESTGLLELFANQSDDFIFGRNDYIKILFGVDEFLVQKEYANKGFEWLLRLDNLGYEYKSNRPADSIEKVLCTWYNFSAFQTKEEKIHAANMAIEYDVNSWDIVYKCLPNTNTSMIGTLIHPQYRKSVRESQVLSLDVYDLNKSYIKILIDNAEFETERWNKLLELSDDVSDEIRKNIFEALAVQMIQMSDAEKVVIKNKIREMIYKHRFYSNATWAMNPEKIVEYEELLNGIKFEYPEYEYVYLFQSRWDKILSNPIPYELDCARNENDKKAEELIKLQIIEFKKKNYSLDVLVDICKDNPNSSLGEYLGKYYGNNSFDEKVYCLLYTTQESHQMALDYCNECIKKDINNFTTIMSYKEEFEYSDQYIKELYLVESKFATKIPQISNAPEKIKHLYWASGMIFRNNCSEWAIEECRKYGTVSSFLELLYYENQQKKIDMECLLTFLSELEQMEYGNKKHMDNYYLKCLLHLVQKKYSNDKIKAGIIARVELRFFYMLDWDDMICFQKEIKKNPENYAELVSIIYKNDEGFSNYKEYSPEIVQVYYKLFDMARFCPGEDEGNVNQEDINLWISRFRNILEKNNQIGLFGFLVGRLLSFSPVGKDGFYPCEAVRMVIEEYYNEDLEREYQIATYNKRGIFTPSAGKEEKSIALNYKKTADYLAIEYPKTAGIFFRLYEQYMSESERERRQAENGQF